MDVKDFDSGEGIRAGSITGTVEYTDYRDGKDILLIRDERDESDEYPKRFWRVEDDGSKVKMYNLHCEVTSEEVEVKKSCQKTL